MEQAILSAFLPFYAQETNRFEPDARKGPQEDHRTFHAVFAAAVRALKEKERPHRNRLPPEPKYYGQLRKHPLGGQFQDAARAEMKKVLEKGTWRVIDRAKSRGKILPLKWVFLYKFDESGHLVKCKARICVRGDLQDAHLESTYAATLAAKAFRIAMAIAAKFDLEVDQLDVVNAYLNSKMSPDQQPVFVELPDGFKQAGKVAQLDRPLYGLKDAPVLWYNTLTETLEEMGLTKSSEEPCLFTNDWLTVLFYVDDILLIYDQKHEQQAVEFKKRFGQRFEIRDEGAVKWFLGIRVIRDRETRRIWLSQSSYLEKLATKFNLLDENTRFPALPIPVKEFAASQEQATKADVKTYQEKIGSILYAAVTTRPDVARAASVLSRFLTNPSNEHMKAADQTILYLYATRFLALEFSGGADDVLFIACDASFADIVDSRHSSQGYLATLFGGPVVWKAAKQNTVSTSTTEAELRGVHEVAKEGYSLERLLRDLELDLHAGLTIHCDNLQTIRLITKADERIATNLRHIDIQNMWLRQEYQKGRFDVSYIPTAEMPADGFTKNLSRQQFEHFVSLLNLQDARERIQTEDARSQA